jgi:hypothetical protein
VKLKTGQDTIIEDAADFETHIVGGECFEIDERVFNEPEAVVNEFAQHELNNYLGTAPFTHEYNGIEGVDRIGGIATALALVQD